MPRQHLAPLTSVRFFAAGAIVLGHSLGKWGLSSPRESGLSLGVGVDLFFVLSGFILAYNYRDIPNVGHGLKIIGYRIARIWPLHITVLFGWFLFVYDPAHPIHDASKLWACVLLVQSWIGNYTFAYQGNAPSWTLSVELFFYLLFPIFVCFRSSGAIMLFTAMISLATIRWAEFYWGATSVTTDAISGGAIMRMHPGSYLILFSSGMVAANLFLSREWRLKYSVATLLEVVALLLAVYFFARHHAFSHAVSRTLYLTGPWTAWAPHLFGVFFFTPLIFLLAIGKGAISHAFRSKTLVSLGNVSFATYLVHQPIQIIMIEHRLHTSIYMLPVFLGTVLAVSYLAFFLVEKPSNRYLRDWIRGLGMKKAPA